MDGMNRMDRSGFPPPPPPQSPSSRAHPSTLPSSFLEGFSHSIVPHYQSQNPQNNPLISGSGGYEVSLRTETVTVLADDTGDPQPDLNSDDRRLRRFVQNSCLHQLFLFFFFKNTLIILVLILVMLADRLLSNRISTHKSRLRRISYINEMETQVKEFEVMNIYGKQRI